MVSGPCVAVVGVLSWSIWAVRGVAELCGLPRGWSSAAGGRGQGGEIEWTASRVAWKTSAWRKPWVSLRIVRRPLRMMRAGMLKRIRRSVWAVRRSGASSGALPEAPAAGHRSQHHAVRLTASSAAVSQSRLALTSPEGRWRSAWPSLVSFRRSSIWARWRWKCSTQTVGWSGMSVRDEAVAEHRRDLAREGEGELVGVDRLAPSRVEAAVGDLLGAERHAPGDQP